MEDQVSDRIPCLRHNEFLVDIEKYILRPYRCSEDVLQMVQKALFINLEKLHLVPNIT